MKKGGNAGNEQEHRENAAGFQRLEVLATE
jgi:hypothetical protein